MADKAPLFAQFDGDEINGKVYGLGDQIDDDLDTGTLEYLKTVGRIGFAKPAQPIMIPSSDMPIEMMNRDELEGALRGSIDFSGYDDDDLREKLIDLRQRKEEKAKGEADDSAAAKRAAAYEAIKDKPLSTLRTDELMTVAEVEVVDIAGLTNNVERAKAIQTARDAA